MAAQNETMTEIAKALSRGPAKMTLSKLGDPNMTSFKNMVNYLSSLRDAGVLNNETHVTKILELAEKDDERAFADAQASKKYILGYVLIFSVLFIFATVFLVGQNTELYKEMLKLLAMFLGGLGSGFGLKGYLDRKKD
jgi:hypothetical protein